MATRRRLPSRRARLLRLAALAWTLGAAVACGAERPEPEATAGLVMLSGDRSEARLTAWGVDGAATSLELPDQPVAWISVGRRGTVVATTSNGTLLLSDRVVVGDAAVEWRAVPGPDTEMPTQPVLFATWSANGLRLAALATDFAADHSIVVVDPVGDSSLIIPMESPLLPAPPAWIAEQQVAVAVPAGLAVVDVSTGETVGGPVDGRFAAATGDGSFLAIVTAEDGRVDVRTGRDWPADTSSLVETVEGERGTEVGSLAFDRLGSRLAVAWERPGEPALVVVYGRAQEWAEIGRLEAPERASEAVVGWLP